MVAIAMATRQPSTSFIYPADEPTADETVKSIRLETLRGVSQFLGWHIIARRHGKLPAARTIAVRLIVLEYILKPEEFTSLAAIARELGCSRSWLSKVGLEFADAIGMRASWQRISLRTSYAKRAKGVHAGTWIATAKRERDRMRAAAAPADANSPIEKAARASGHAADPRRLRAGPS